MAEAQRLVESGLWLLRSYFLKIVPVRWAASVTTRSLPWLFADLDVDRRPLTCDNREDRINAGIHLQPARRPQGARGQGRPRQCHAELSPRGEDRCRRPERHRQVDAAEDH